MSRKHFEHTRNKKMKRHEEREERMNRQVSDCVQGVKDRVATNISHTIPKSRAREGYRTQNDTNMVRKPIVEHNEWHKIFHNMTPQEVCRWIRDFTRSVLSEKADKKLEELESMEEREFYSPDVLA